MEMEENYAYGKHMIMCVCDYVFNLLKPSDVILIFVITVCRIETCVLYRVNSFPGINELISKYIDAKENPVMPTPQESIIKPFMI